MAGKDDGGEGEAPIEPETGVEGDGADSGDSGDSSFIGTAADIASVASASQGAGRRIAQALNSTGIGFLIFALGIVTGFPLAVVGFEFLANNSDTLAALFFGLIISLTIGAVIFFLSRKWIWQRLFSVAENQLEQFADPIVDAAQHAAQNRAADAAEAARRFAHVALARWAWISTRRWIIASLTGLIAALAALAGSALLFKQNELLGLQIVRLDEQNALLFNQIELADGNRAAGLIGEISRIADGIAAEATQFNAAGETAKLSDAGNLSASLKSRIVAATLAARPYRYLDSGREPAFVEAARERPDIPSLLKVVENAGPPPHGIQLIEKPLSLERGLIATILYHSGVTDFGGINFIGADFSAAVLSDRTLAGLNLRHGRLQGASLQRVYAHTAIFSGAYLERIDFTDAVLYKSNLSSVTAAEVEAPFGGDPAGYATQLTGGIFNGAAIMGSDFDGALASLSRFDGALVANTTFRGAILGGVTFRNAIIIDSDFTGADLRSTDFDGAYVFQEDFLARLKVGAAEGTFVQERFVQEPVDISEPESMTVLFSHIGSELPNDLLEGRKAWRIKRVKPFG